MKPKGGTVGDIVKLIKGIQVSFLMQGREDSLEGIYLGEDDFFYFIDDTDSREQLNIVKDKVIAIAIPTEDDIEPEQEANKKPQKKKNFWG